VIHINRQNGFVVRGMRVSPVYIDGMSIATSVDGLRMVSDLMFQKLSSETFDVVAAPSISGIPYASILANRFEKRLVIDRGLPSKHGMRRRIADRRARGGLLKRAKRSTAATCMFSRTWPKERWTLRRF
jgi:orotate phosphoribosyltransferase